MKSFYNWKEHEVDDECNYIFLSTADTPLHFTIQTYHFRLQTIQTYHFRLQTKFNWLAVPKNVIEMLADIISFLWCHDFD